MATKDTSGYFDQTIFEESMLQGKKFFTRNDLYECFDFEGYFSYKVRRVYDKKISEIIFLIEEIK